MRSRAQPREHRKLALALVVVASLLLFISTFALWANRQLLDTDNWTDTSTELLENEDIRTQVAAFLVDELYANVDVQARLREALPPRAAPLAGPAAGGLRQLTERAANILLTRPRGQEAWEAANRTAHKLLLDVVEDRSDVVSTTGGNVVLDLKTLLAQTESRIGIGGRVGEKIPPDAAQITILRSDQLGLAQDLVRILKASAVVLIVLALALLAVAIYLARAWRREALRAAGIGFVVAGVGALAVRAVVGNALVDALATTESVKPAIDATWTITTSLLEEAAVAAIGYGVVIILAAWLAGPTRAAVASRRVLAPFLREPGIAYGGLAAIVLLVVAWGPTPATQRLVPMLFMVALLIAGTEVLRRQTAREHPDASLEDLTRRIGSWLSDARDSVRGRPLRGRGRVDELERLGRLRDTGVLDAAEFEREKRRILGSKPAPAR